MAFHLRPSIVNAAFVILFAVIAGLAWATASATSAPWYDAAVGLQVYALAAVLSTLLATVVVLTTSRRVSDLESSLLRVERRVGMLRAKVRKNPSNLASASGSVSLPELDTVEALDGLAGGGAPSMIRIERQGHDTLVPVPEGVSSSKSFVVTEVLRQLVRERNALRQARARVWTVAAGPVLTCLVFLAIAGPMLPGSAGFAAAHFQLNTALILFLAYGLPPLVAWSLVALGMLGGSSRRWVP